MDITDILIHVHPELSASLRAKIEEEVGNCEGVVSAHFSPGHPHEFTVAYDPRIIASQRILDARAALGRGGNDGRIVGGIAHREESIWHMARRS